MHVSVISIKSFVSGDKAQLVELRDDDLEITGSSPLCVIIFLTTIFACWHTSLQVETYN